MITRINSRMDELCSRCALSLSQRGKKTRREATRCKLNQRGSRRSSSNDPAETPREKEEQNVGECRKGAALSRHPCRDGVDEFSSEQYYRTVQSYLRDILRITFAIVSTQILHFPFLSFSLSLPLRPFPARIIRTMQQCDTKAAVCDGCRVILSTNAYGELASILAETIWHLNIMFRARARISVPLSPQTPFQIAYQVRSSVASIPIFRR